MGVVPCLDEGRDQLNKRFPKRDKTSDGAWGDKAHQLEPSSHNGDKSGKPEWADGDNKDEVRARDFDKDLNDPAGVTMEDVVQLWVKLARAGVLWWIGYIIYNGRIWYKSDGYQTHVYTGKNKHDQHAHVNSDFTQKADDVTGTNWHLDDLKKPAAPKPPTPSKPTPVKVIKEGDEGAEVRKIQDFFRRNFPGYRLSVPIKRNVVISVDGFFGKQTTAWVKEFQKRTALKQDGKVGPKTMAKLKYYGYR